MGGAYWGDMGGLSGHPAPYHSAPGLLLTEFPNRCQHFLTVASKGPSPMTENSNLSIVLDEMAVRAGAFYRKSNENYMEAAAELVKARDLVPHGGWGPWLQKARIPGRTATRMMRLHRAGIKSATVANIGVGRIDELLGRYRVRRDAGRHRP